MKGQQTRLEQNSLNSQGTMVLRHIVGWGIESGVLGAIPQSSREVDTLEEGRHCAFVSSLSIQ